MEVHRYREKVELSQEGEPEQLIDNSISFFVCVFMFQGLTQLNLLSQ
jgi:hypothetical protein